MAVKGLLSVLVLARNAVDLDKVAGVLVQCDGL